MDITLALLADAANTTANGKLNVLGVFSQIGASKFPYTHPSLTLVLKFVADAVEAGQRKEIAIHLVDADGQRLHQITLNTQVPASQRPGKPIEVLTNIGIGNLKFERPGDYEFKVVINGDHRASIPLAVGEAGPPGLPFAGA